MKKVFHQFSQVKEIRNLGALMAIQFDSSATNFKVLNQFLNVGLFSDWFLWCDSACRIAPPLIFDELCFKDLNYKLALITKE